MRLKCVDLIRSHGFTGNFGGLLAMRLPLPGIVLALLAIAHSPTLRAEDELDPNQPYSAEKSNPVTYDVDFAAIVTPPYKCQKLRVWLPLPQSDSAQEVT